MSSTGSPDQQQRIAELEAQLDEAVTERARLIELATQLNSTLDLDELLRLVMDSAAELLESETSSLLLLDEETDELIIKVATGDSGGAVTEHRIPADKGVAGWALQNQETVVINDTSTDDRFYQDVDAASGFTTRNLLAVPLLVKDRAVGVVEVLNKRDGMEYHDEDVALAGGLASLAAVAMDNAALYARLSDAVVTARMVQSATMGRMISCRVLTT